MARVLSDVDHERLRQLLADHRQQRRNSSGRSGDQSIDHQESPAPSVYVTKTPAAGIPALIDGQGTGTGTGMILPGVAECMVYQATLQNGRWALDEVYGNAVEVLNISSNLIDGSEWVVVQRDRYGCWFAGATGGGSGDRIEVVELYNSGVTPPEGYLDARIVYWRVATNSIEYGELIWLKDLS